MEINLEKIESELGIDKEVVVELLKEYLKESEGILAKLEAAVTSGDYATMITTAHTLKGSSGNLRVTLIQDAARTVEMAAREKTDTATIGGLVTSLKALHDEMRTLFG